MNEYTFDELAVGMSESFSVTVTPEMLDRFRTDTGDINPLHNDEAFALERGYTGRVAYGMLTASFLSTLAGVYLPGKWCLIQRVETDFPEPDSPTIASVSPLYKSKETPRTACTVPPAVRKETVRFFTSSFFSIS